MPKDMPLEEIARSHLKSSLRSLLKSKEVCRRVAFEIKQNHYAELDIAVPLGFDLSCPVTLADHWHSFAEIFVEKTYGDVFENAPLPNRWIDLGCHAGYFSLFVVWLRAKQKLEHTFKSLLIDADPRVETAVETLTKTNHLEERMLFQQGAIAQSAGEKDFAIREVMSSSLVEKPSGHPSTIKINALLQDDLMALLPPPYDLIKVDIEGMEYEFLCHYDRLLANCKYLLIEWHSWHQGGGGAQQIQDLARQQQFKLIKETEPAHAVQFNGQPHQCGVFLFGK
jgi:FkbM family methyltransferase